MNICIALARFFPRYYGGMTNDAYHVARRLRERGHRVWILCTEEESPSGPSIVEGAYDGFPVVRIFVGNRTHAGDRQVVGFDSEIGRVVQRLLEERDAEILAVWNFATLSTALVPAAHAIGVPVVYKATDFGATCWRYTLVRWDGSLCDGREELLHCLDCWRPWSAKSAWVFRSLQGLSDPTRRRVLKAWGRLPGWKPWVIDRALLLQRRLAAHRQALQSVDLVLAPSTWMRDVLQLNGVATEKVVVSFYGMDPPPPDQLDKSASEVVRFGYIGRIHPTKGVADLVQAFPQLADPRGATLRLFGAPTARDEIAYGGRVWSLAKGCERLRLEPAFSPDKLTTVFQDIDVLVVPSTWYENSSLVVLEALAHRTPVIMSDVAGNRDHVVHGYNGLLFPPGDVSALSQAMQRCISEPGLIGRLATNASLVQPLDPQIAELESLFQGLLRIRRGI